MSNSLRVSINYKGEDVPYLSPHEMVYKGIQYDKKLKTFQDKFNTLSGSIQKHNVKLANDWDIHNQNVTAEMPKQNFNDFRNEATTQNFEVVDLSPYDGSQLTN